MTGFVIAHLSDPHFGAHLPDVARSLVDDVVAAAPALTVVTGDLTMRARESQFTAARELLDALPRPLLVVLGNHDLPLFSPVRLWAPYRRYQAQIASELDPFLDIPGVQALGLHSMPRWRWKGGRVSQPQSAAVITLLGDASPSRLRLIALHHPVSPTGLARIAGRNALLRSCVEAEVDLVLAGHTHVPAVRRLDLAGNNRAWPVLEVVAGTATSTRLRGHDRSWNLIQVEPGTIRVQARHQSGTSWHTGSDVVHARGVHGLATAGDRPNIR